MKIKRLGRTGLRVTEICLGTMTFGNQCDEPTSHAIMDKAFEKGVTFFDTADVYPLGSTPEMVGRTEEYIGSWLRTGKREQIVLRSRENLADSGHCFQIEQFITVGLRAPQLFGKTTVRRDLIRHNHSFESLSTEFQ